MLQRAVTSSEGGDGRSQGGRWSLAERSVMWCPEGGEVGRGGPWPVSLRAVGSGRQGGGL